MSYARSILAVALAGRRVLAPLAALALVAAGVFAYRPNEVQESWALTALLAMPIGAWIVWALERDAGPDAAAMLAVRAGGAVAAWRGRVVIAIAAAAAVALVLVGWPIAIDAFDRTAGAGDVLNATSAHLSAGLAGGALALALADPVRPGTASGVVIVALIATTATTVGPGGIAAALADAPDDTLTARLALHVAITLALAGGLAVAARAVCRRRG